MPVVTDVLADPLANGASRLSRIRTSSSSRAMPRPLNQRMPQSSQSPTRTRTTGFSAELFRHLPNGPPVGRSEAPRTNQSVAIPAGDHVHVEMEHVLPACSSVRLEQGHTVRIETLLNPSADGVRRPRHVGKGLLVDRPDVLGVELRDDQRVAVARRAPIERPECWRPRGRRTPARRRTRWHRICSPPDRAARRQPSARSAATTMRSL